MSIDDPPNGLARACRSLSPIPFNRPFVTGRELPYIDEAIRNIHLSGDGEFSRRCERWLERSVGSSRAFLTPSCTAALEMAAILLGIGPGDEVILPSFTFVSTANAFLLRGAELVFVDVREDTLNLDECAVEAALTARTRAIVPVHYAGVACEMDALSAIASGAGAVLVEDAAQALLAGYRGRSLGSFGSLATISFHETKNVQAGEGGALLVNDPELVDRAAMIRHKGTDRQAFLEGAVDKYTWQCVGSSFVPSEITAAFLFAQLEEAAAIRDRRLALWRGYYSRLEALEKRGLVRRPVIPGVCEHNAHTFHLLLREGLPRWALLDYMKRRGVQAVFHYVPLHDSPYGQRFRRIGDLRVTESAAARLIRLPLWLGMDDAILDEVVSVLEAGLVRLAEGKTLSDEVASTRY
jgi:dTDP-4-amino-4,6-dideoxygalactose transaminase